MGLLTLASEHAVRLFCGLACLWLVGRAVAYARLRRFGGPVLAGWSDWPHSLAMLRHRNHEWYAEVNQRHGPIARIAPNVLVTSSPDVWIHVNTKPGYKRSDWYYNACRLEHRRDNIFSQTDNRKHDQRRKQMAQGYSGRENLELENTIDQRLGEFLGLIREHHLSPSARDPTKPMMDLGQKVQFFTLDVISSVGLGRSFGMLPRNADVDGYVRLSEEGLVAANAALATGLSRLAHVPGLGRLLSPSPRDASGYGRVMAACFRAVDERVARPGGAGGEDMLASFMRHGLVGDDLRTEALEQVVAGSDTTASALRGALLHILTNPRVYAELRHEVDGEARSGSGPDPGSAPDIISAARARQLPYLQAVVREALRIWPPAVNIFARDVPPSGDTVIVDGRPVLLPGGVSIGYSALAMHRSRDVYGPDAQTFRPERWFEPDPDRLAAMVRTNELIFGHARFRCLGRPVAMIEISKTIFELMRNFDMAVVHPTNPWKTRNCLGLFMITDMWVQVTDRVS